MLSHIKRTIPTPIKKMLLTLYDAPVVSLRKTLLVRKMSKKHKILLEGLKGKQRIKVVFLSFTSADWKVDAVFKRMLADPFFDPIILVCPITVYFEEIMWEMLNRAYQYFKSKNYPVIHSYLHEEKNWLSLKELEPDIVFFLNPHNLTRIEYSQEAYLNYLSCYVPYHHEDIIGAHQFDRYFHNAQWKIFATHKYSKEIYEKHSHAKGRNVVLTGFPAMEEIATGTQVLKNKFVWKTNDARKKIIWAPHHTIESSGRHFSNFIEYAEEFKELAEKYQKQLVWSFKPHPGLKEKLYKYDGWGKKKTDEYYQWWDSNEYTQLNVSDYEDLFLTSNAMIHDSGSFLIEYLYYRKPVMYLQSKFNKTNLYNTFGLKAFNSCRIGRNVTDIENFLKELIFSDTFTITKEHADFYSNELIPYFEKELPSEKIVSIIKGALTHQ